ncbi:MAG TPA: hypothetical protein VF692_11125, partial [Pyrinomonadaceae bacterium]
MPFEEIDQYIDSIAAQNQPKQPKLPAPVAATAPVSSPSAPAAPETDPLDDYLNQFSQQKKPARPKKPVGLTTAQEIDELLASEHGEKFRKFFGAVKWAEGGRP